ncbi:MAG TPA: hypothetical protein VMV39_08600 [Terracidiphilus sp.]|nr:hypothetical protein [Terracidiphilus sp.]
MKDFRAKDLLKSRDAKPMLESLAKVAGEQRKIHSVAYGIVVDDFNSFSLGERRFFDRRYLDGFWEIGHKRVR